MIHMDTQKNPHKALLFSGLIYNSVVNPCNIFEILEKEFGQIIFKSTPFIFNETDYYKAEMGENLERLYVAFDKFIDMDFISTVKLRTNEFEVEYFSKGGKRQVNIDPGYITSGKVVLATTKNFQHRIYLCRGIYAEVTLRYRKGSFEPWEWTYRDYRRKESVEFFNQLRNIYRQKAQSGLQ
jgi:hypothetical protein